MDILKQLSTNKLERMLFSLIAKMPDEYQRSLDMTSSQIIRASNAGRDDDQSALKAAVICALIMSRAASETSSAQYIAVAHVASLAAAASLRRVPLCKQHFKMLNLNNQAALDAIMANVPVSKDIKAPVGEELIDDAASLFDMTEDLFGAYAMVATANPTAATPAGKPQGESLLDKGLDLVGLKGDVDSKALSDNASKVMKVIKASKGK